MKRFTFKAACLLVAVAMTAFLLTGCKEKDPVSTNDFETTAAQKGYMVQDGTDFFKDYDYIKLVTLAAPQDKSFQIEFYELNDEATAKSFYESNKNNFVMMKGEDFIDKSDSGNNYDLYKLEMYGKFMMIERVKNTVVYVPSTDSENKSAIESFLSELKY
ncbi:MAG: hypothetical protein IJM51_09120 [Clostridia bacterium]|nr:hypothetical protein [Clostridia bacterium]